MVTKYCPVCGRKHPEIADCAKFGVHICSRHCDECEYRVGGETISFCGYKSTLRALKIPLYFAPEESIIEEKEKLQKMRTEEITAKYEQLREWHKNGQIREMKYFAQLGACQRILFERRDGESARKHIPEMPSEEIREYRLELCRFVVENKMNDTLKSAVLNAMDICSEVLEGRRRRK